MMINRLFELGGRVAIVTGGATGIGSAIAGALAAAGAVVVIAARDAARGEKVAATMRLAGEHVHYLRVDVTDEESCRCLVARVLDSYGQLDILVNNAGMSLARLPQETSLEDWRTVVDVNLTGAFLLSRAAFPSFERSARGKIINIGSIATLFGNGISTAYCVSKGGIGQLTKSLASAWGSHNVQVNALLPGYIETEMFAEARAQRPDLERRIFERMPLRRFGRPEDMAGAAVFLASSASDFITGALIPVDGGYTCQL